MIANVEWKAEIVIQEEKVDNEERRVLSRGVEHMLCTVARHRGKWDGTMFRPTSNACQKYQCTFKCREMVRIPLKCNKVFALCNQYFVIQFAENNVAVVSV